MASPIIIRPKRKSPKHEDEPHRKTARKPAKSNGLTCAICMNDLKPMTTKILENCHHSFCYTCLCERQISHAISWHRCACCRQLIYAKDRLDILEYFTRREVKPPLEKSKNDINSLIESSSYLTQEEIEVITYPDFNSITNAVENENVDIKAVHNNMGSILHSIVWTPKGDAVACINLLIKEQKTEVDILNRQSHTPLDLAIIRYDISPSIQLSIIKSLLDFGADPNYNKHHLVYYASLLYRCLIHDNPELISLIISYGAKPPEEDNEILRFLLGFHSAKVADIILEHFPGLVDFTETRGPLLDRYLFSNCAVRGDIQMMQYWKKRGLNTLHACDMSKDLICQLLSFNRSSDDSSEYLPAIKFLCRSDNWNRDYDWQKAIKTVLPKHYHSKPSKKERIKPATLTAIAHVFNAVDADCKHSHDFIDENNLLHRAIIANDYDAAKLFIKVGASLHSRDSHGKCCLDLLDKANDEIKILITREQELFMLKSRAIAKIFEK